MIVESRIGRRFLFIVSVLVSSANLHGVVNEKFFDEYNLPLVAEYALAGNLNGLQTLSPQALMKRDWKWNRNALFYASTSQSIDFLIKQGLSLNVVDYDGNTPLMVAAFWNDANKVKLLINAGASVNFKNPLTNQTALSIAEENNNEAITIQLLFALVEEKLGSLSLQNDSIGQVAEDILDEIVHEW